MEQNSAAAVAEMPATTQTEGVQGEGEQGDHVHDANKCNVTEIGFSFKTPLPELFNRHINLMLHMAAHYLKEGREAPLLFVGLDAEGEGHLIDPDGIPVHGLIQMMVRGVLKEMSAVACLRICEGWSLPEDVSKVWAEGGRPEGMKVSEHPEAFEVLMIQIETLNGTWGGRVRLNPTIEGQERTVQGEMEFEKLDNYAGQFANMLPQNVPEGEEEGDPVMQLIAKLIGGRMSKDEDKDEDGKVTTDGGDKPSGNEPKIVIIGV